MKKNIPISMAITFLLASLLLITNLVADVTLPRLISDGMVLQRDVPVKCWGWASPGETVTVTMDDVSVDTVTNKVGEWQLELPQKPAGGPYSITVTGSNTIELNDVLIGDVWLCSGQSNMTIPMERVKERYWEAIATANFPRIRQFHVPIRSDVHGPGEKLDGGEWVAANPATVMKFTAIGFFFARELIERYDVPIGLINSSVGGTPVEAWMPLYSLKSDFPEMIDTLRKFQDDEALAKKQAKQKEASDAWFGKLYSTDAGLEKGREWFSPDLDDSSWGNYELPGKFVDQAIDVEQGVVWFRKTFTLPPIEAGRPAKLMMGRIVESDKAYVNGQFVGEITYQYPPRRYTIPEGLLRPGKNTITMRVVVNGGSRGEFIDDKPYWLGIDDFKLDLTGDWKYCVGTVLDERQPSGTWMVGNPTVLFNTMIAPIVNYPIKGTIWYQGESNIGRDKDYAVLFPRMITEWRKLWDVGNFPFLFVQLANLNPACQEPTESGIAALRAAQAAALKLPNSNMIVAHDLGEWNDIHPLNKGDVGKRLSLLARKMAYGEKDLVATGPRFHSLSKEGSILVVSFTNAGSGLATTNGKSLSHFAIAGEDGKFHWANASIEGNNVVVSSEAVANPVKVRYAWADNPEGANLCNLDGLPAEPFEAAVE